MECYSAIKGMRLKHIMLGERNQTQKVIHPKISFIYETSKLGRSTETTQIGHHQGLEGRGEWGATAEGSTSVFQYFLLG